MQEDADRKPGEKPAPSPEEQNQAAAGHEQPPASPEEQIAELRQKLGDAEAKAQEHWERYLRATAEQDNIRKRSEREVDAARRFALEKFAGDLLPVCDSLELGLKAAREAGAEAGHIEGIELTLKMFGDLLRKHGLEPIDPAGELFDPEQHEAMTAVPSADARPNSVIEVVQKGFSLNGRLIRPARVVVAKAVAPESDA